MVLTDSLTGLGNRWSVERALDAVLLRTPAQEFTIKSTDVDGLKLVYDAQGDRLLQSVAPAFTRALRPLGAVSRIGGNAFAIVCPLGASPDAAQAVQGHAAASLLAQEFALAEVSFRLATYPHDAIPTGDLLRPSDQRRSTRKIARRTRQTPSATPN